jgi:Na+-transporting NADH:ubiquinone oxidoreductase subunit C
VKDSLRTLLFAAVLGTVCALLLTGAAVFTEPHIVQNREAERMRNLLGVFEVACDEDATFDQLKDTYEANVVKPGEKDELKLFRYQPDKNSAPKAVAVHFVGKGMWAPIKGYLALDPSLTTIEGVTFYQQEETPGLGGEIGTENFKKRLKGKTLRDAAGQAGIRILRSGATGPNELNGLSGATVTCGKVEDMLNDAIRKILKEGN